MCFRPIIVAAFLGLFAALPRIGYGQDVAALRQGVVKILASVDGREKTGTGFVVRLEPDIAHIVTASHVVEGDKKPRVAFFDRQSSMVEGEVLKLESGDDRGLALLVVRGKDNLPPGVKALAINAGAGVSPADQTVVVGFPKGGSGWSISSAMVSGKDGRDLVLSGQIAEGNSGGPLIKQGKVVGVVVQEKQGFGRAVPSDILRSTLEGWGVSSNEDCRLADVTAPKSSPSTRPSVEADSYLSRADALFRAKRYREATTLLRTAYELGHFGAGLELALRDWSGRGTEKDELEAIRLFREICNAATAGNPSAQTVVGEAYEIRAGWLSNDVTAAPKWYLKAAEQGDLIAQRQLGVAFVYGRGVPKDLGEAVRWTRKAAENGEPEAQFGLGTLYEAGSGVDKNVSEAFIWYRKAAAQGNLKAEATLGAAYLLGRVVLKDYQEAARWLKRAAASGHAESQYFLGRMYERGSGVPRDQKLAVEWLRKAARQGEKKAQTQLEYNSLTW